MQLVDEFLTQLPQARNVLALNPFYFCSESTIVTPTGIVASTLEEFAQGIRRVSIHSIHYHFLEARLRRQLETNDFSLWLGTNLHLNEAAQKINRIDIYTSTLEDVRRQILQALETTPN